MAYLNFNKITPPAPNDPNVDEVTQLNNNWDQLDTKLQPYIIGGTISNLEPGQEFFDTNFRYAVWDGTATRIPDDVDANWSAWTTMPLLSPRSGRVGGVLKWRNNSVLRMVELTGGVLFDSSANAWTLGTLFTINGDVAGAIPGSMVPVGAEHRAQCAAGQTTTPSVVSCAYVIVDKPGGNTYVRIRAQYLGGPGGGNFIAMEQVSWWY